MLRLLRLLKIIFVVLRFGLDEFLLAHERVRWLRMPLNILLFLRNTSKPRAVRLRLALESLGPIFVKFGQMLSTRRDLMPADIADELARLQDRVPPFPSAQAIAMLEATYGKPLHEVFKSFDEVPIASASVAQVHFAVLPDGRDVAVKILRPGITGIIRHDVALLKVGADLVEWLWAEGHRLKPRQVIEEFEKHLADELDLMREAANASQLKRNFADSPLLLVPEMYWDYCSAAVMVMQRMYGITISQVGALREAGIDIPRLAANGVEIFYMQVFEVHIESGWAPADTRVDELEAAVRAVCEPIFDRPLREVSFGRVLLRLFQTSRRFGIEVQPQLVLLQKTLLNIEGLGLQLDPELDLWKTAKPWLEHWMSEQVGWRGLLKTLREEAPYYATLLPQLPRLLHRRLANNAADRGDDTLLKLLAQQKRYNALLVLISLLLLGILAWQLHL